MQATDKYTPASALLGSWVERQLDDPSLQWFRDRCNNLRGTKNDRDLYLALGLTPKKLGKADLELSSSDLASASALRPGWNPSGWSVDQAARLVMLFTASQDPDQFQTWIERLANTADVGELVALYRGLPLYPDQSRYAARASEGIRTNIRPVFEAVAHDNPFPREQLDEGAWNQMVLKALFIGSPLWPIQGLDQRANPTLATMLCEYAHERWSAGRNVSPELWRCVGPNADENGLSDLTRVLENGEKLEKIAAILALTACPRTKASSILEQYSNHDVKPNGAVSDWERIGREFQAETAN